MTLKIQGPIVNHTQGAQPQGLVVIFHGYGASGENLSSLAYEWQRTLPTLDFMVPNGVDPWEGGMFGGYQWFSLVDWDPKRIEKNLDALRPHLIAFLDEELQKRNLNYQNLILVGFSQGAILALDLGLHGRQAPAGVIAYSGGYISQKDIAHLHVSVLLIHGADDEVLRSESSYQSHTHFEKAGVPSQLHILDNLEHSIDPRGVRLGREFIQGALGAN